MRVCRNKRQFVTNPLAFKMNCFQPYRQLHKKIIFIPMKLSAYIFFFIMLSMTALPFSSICTQKEQTCSESCCKKEPCKKENKENKNCNPFTTCPLCSSFLPAKPSILIAFTLQSKIIFFIKNDNRIIQNLSECWHPPNMEI